MHKPYLPWVVVDRPLEHSWIFVQQLKRLHGVLEFWARGLGSSERPLGPCHLTVYLGIRFEKQREEMHFKCSEGARVVLIKLKGLQRSDLHFHNIPVPSWAQLLKPTSGASSPADQGKLCGALGSEFEV